MNKKITVSQTVETLTEQQVADWLLEHLDFLQQHPDIVAKITLPDMAQGAISLHQRQLQVLRESNSELEGKLRTIVENAKRSQAINSNLLKLAAALIGNAKADMTDSTVPELIQNEFDFNHVSLKTDVESMDFATLSVFVAKGESACFNKPPRDLLQAAFGKQADEVETCALVPINAPGRQKLMAILALGAADQRFRPSLGVDFLDELGRLLATYV